MTPKDALRLILSDPKADPYAKTYAQAGLAMETSSHEFRVQMLYVLNNLRFWRHPDAKEVRKILKENTP